MITGNTICGFTVIRTCSLRELDAVMYHFRHEKTGLELVWISRTEENKTFGIAFQTLPEDDTGVFHILEHSVLCGSERYPVKEPFVELMKNSMNTFLNAMTFPDRTFYPISSRNPKDFMNLTRVYLDAVFRPLIYSRPEIFRQEGWHYELDENGAPGIKGVVYNEMRGLFADADELESLAVQRALFPDTPYRFESGGDPAAIPELTYEQFLENHRRCYSPSNAYVFLDGDLDINAVLALLDEEYLSGFERGERLPIPAAQRPVKAAPQRVEFELPAEEDGESRFRLALAGVIGEIGEREKLTAMQVLSAYLCGDNQAALSRAVLAAGLAEAVTMPVNDGVAQPYVNLEVRNLKEADIPAVRELLRTELKRMAEEGLNRDKLEAIMANFEFQLRERDYGMYPQGLIFGFNVLDSWMRGGAPEAKLEVGRLFDVLRAWMEEGRFEQLIREVLLDNPHSCEVVMAPSHTAGELRRAAEAKRLEGIAAAWSAEEREKLEAEQRELSAWQKSEDTAENLATLPRLSLSDVNREPEFIPTELSELGGVPLLRHDIAAGGINYLTLYFDVTGLQESEISALSFLAGLLGKVETEKHTAEELSRMTQLQFGTLYFSTPVYENVQGGYSLKLAANASMLETKADDAIALLCEILTQSRFTNEKEINELLRQTRTRMFQQLISNGHSAALGRAAAQCTAGGAASECAGGFAYYQWLRDKENNWDFAALSEELQRLCAQAVNRMSLTVSLTGSASGRVNAAAEALISALPGMERPASALPQRWAARREGIEIPSDVGYAAMGARLDGYSGDRQLVARVVTLAYLWNAVRVQGGAYGTGLVMRDSGFAGCYSYRDPSASSSLAAYTAAPDFLANFAAAGETLDGYIIGAVAANEPLLTVRAKGLTADSFYFRGISHELRCAHRAELLASTPARLMEIAEDLRAAMADAGVCVFAPREELERCGLDVILTL